jgi:CRP-like cAMP-binding protein
VRAKPVPETYEQAMILLHTIRLQKLDGLKESFKYLFDEWPEMKQTTHQHLANLLGLARETVSRNFWSAI